jgi:hypothetical protein
MNKEGTETPEEETADATPEPQAMVMSRIQGLESRLAAVEYKSVCGEIDVLVSNGQVQPVKAKTWKEKMNAKQLSLINGDKETDKILALIEGCKDIPKGTYWTADRKSRMDMSRAEERPSGSEWDADAENIKAQEEAGKEMAAMNSTK